MKMNRYISFGNIRKHLLDIKRTGGNAGKINSIFLDELKDLGFISLPPSAGISLPIESYSITKEGEKFLIHSSSLFTRIEYFFKDYPFLGALIISVLGGLIGGTITIILN